jgi:hypothetical protein
LVSGFDHPRMGVIGRYLLEILPARWAGRIRGAETANTLSMRTRLMFIETHAAEVVVHATAIRLAKRCRSVVQACLREEEWHDADLEFYRIIREELEQWQTKPSKVQPPHQEEL